MEELFTRRGRRGDVPAPNRWLFPSVNQTQVVIMEREPYPKVVYTTDGKAEIFINGTAVSDEEALTQLIQTASLVFALLPMDL